MANIGTRKLPHTERHSLFISGIDRIELIGGGMLRLVVYVNETNDAGILEKRESDFDVIMPASSLSDVVGKALATGQAVICREGSITVRLQ